MRYRAFISYSHAADGRLAPAMQNALERFARRWHRPVAFRVFRDKTGLATTPRLWKSIQDALDASEFFVLLASPTAASSEWVGREVSHWIGHKSPATLLLVLTEGELRWNSSSGAFDPLTSTALPPVLYAAFPEEPLFLDLRWARDETQLSLDHNRFRDAIAELAAPLHRCLKEELIGQEVVQRRRFRRVSVAAISVILLLAIAASIAAFVAEQRRRLAFAQQLAAQSAAESANAPDLSLLLAVEAVEVRDQDSTRASLLAALQRHPALFTFLRGHTSNVQHLAVGRKHDVAAVLEDGTLMLWKSFQSAPSEPTNLRLSSPARVAEVAPGEDGFVVLDEAGLINLVDAADARPQRILPPLIPARLLAVHDDSGQIAAAAEDGRVAIYDGAHYAAARVLPGGGLLHTASIAFSDDGLRIAAVSKSGAVVIRRVLDGSVEQRLNPPEDVDAGQIFFTGTDRVLFEEHAVDTSTLLQAPVYVGGHRAGAAIERTAVPGASTVRLARNANSRLVAIGDGLGQIRLLQDGSLVATNRTFAGHLFAITSLAFSPNGAWLVSTASDGRVIVWDVDAGSSLGRHMALKEDRVIAATASDDSRCLALVQERASVSAVECAATAAGERFAIGDGPPTGAIAPSGAAAVATGSGLYAFGIPRGKRSWQRLSPESMEGARVAFNARGDRLAAALNDHLMIWTGERVATVPLCDGTPLAIAASPSGDDIAVGYDTGVVGLARYTHERWTTRCFRTHVSLVHGLAFDAGGNRLAVAGMVSATDRKIRIVSTKDARSLTNLFGRHRGPIRALAFSPDGTLLASAGVDDTIDLWDAAMATPFGPVLKGQPPGTNALTFDSTGRTLVTTTDDTMTTWDFDPASWRKRACRAANRAFADSERDRYLGGAISTACAKE